MANLKEKDVNQTININVPPTTVDEANDSLDKIGRIARLGKVIFQEIGNASYFKIMKVFMVSVLFLFCTVLGVVTVHLVKNQQVVENMVTSIIQAKAEDEANMKIREAVSPKITNELKKILYTANADRVTIFEFHNGKENATNLPFRFADMSYEQINDDDKEIKFSSNEFQNILMTHYRIPYYIAENTYFIGTLDEVMRIDPRFALHMEEVGGDYFGGVILRSNGINIGVLCIFFDKGHKPKETRKEFAERLKRISVVISPLLDLNVQKNILKNDESNYQMVE